jgi:hypothetical protein
LSATDAAAATARIAALRATGIINAFPVGGGTAFSIGTVTNAAQLIQTNRTAVLDEDAYSGRIDYKISDRFSFYGRYQRNRGDLLSPDGTSGVLFLPNSDRIISSLRFRKFTEIQSLTKRNSASTARRRI